MAESYRTRVINAVMTRLETQTSIEAVDNCEPPITLLQVKLPHAWLIELYEKPEPKEGASDQTYRDLSLTLQVAYLHHGDLYGRGREVLAEVQQALISDAFVLPDSVFDIWETGNRIGLTVDDKIGGLEYDFTVAYWQARNNPYPAP